MTALVAERTAGRTREEDQLFTKCGHRLIPFMVLLYIVSFIDRSNVAYAALTMNRDLGFTPTVFGFGAGIFFTGYAAFQVPANLILERVGAKRWMFCILAVWGLVSASNALVQGPQSFYALRLLLGVAEAGFFPGMMLYLTYWFPRDYLSRFTANFMVAIPLSYAIGAPLSSLILRLDGVAGLHGWQWMFLLEGLPAFLLSFGVLKLLPDGPRHASWLTLEEKRAVARRLDAKDSSGRQQVWRALCHPCVLGLGIASFAFQAAGYGFSLWLPQIVQAMGFSALAIGFIVALPFAAGGLAMFLCGRSSSARNERAWHGALPWLLAAVGYGVASLGTSNGIVLAALAVGAVAAFAAYGPFFSLPASFLRGTAAAVGIGFVNTFGSLGGFFGPVIIGELRERSGDYATGMATVALGYLLAALIVLAVGYVTESRRESLAALSS